MGKKIENFQFTALTLLPIEIIITKYHLKYLHIYICNKQIK